MKTQWRGFKLISCSIQWQATMFTRESSRLLFLVMAFSWWPSLHDCVNSYNYNRLLRFFQEAKKKSEPINVCGRESLKDAWQSSCSGTWSMHARQQTSGNKAFGCSQNESRHCNAQPWSWVGHWAESFRRVGLEQHPILYLRGHCYLLQVVKAAAPKFLRAECTVRSKAQRCRSW